MAQFLLDPDATQPYAFDWLPVTHNVQGATRDYLEDGETIASHAVVATTGVTVVSTSESDGIVTVWLSEGVAGTRPTVTCHITTSAGRQDDRSARFVVQDR